MTSHHAFAEAARFFADVTGQVPRDAWDTPGLGEWTVLELVAHTNRALATVVEYLERPQEPQPADGPYFSPEAVAERGRESVRALRDDPAAAVRAAASDAVAAIDAAGADATIGSPAGTMPLAVYVPSRTAELVIHTADLARAIGVTPTVPDAAAEQALTFVAQRAAKKDPLAVLDALTGRGVLPDGFSVY